MDAGWFLCVEWAVEAKGGEVEKPARKLCCQD